jgi:hypothetical protein
LGLRLNVFFEERPFVFVDLPGRENDKHDLERDKLGFEIRKFEADQTKREFETDKLREELLELRRPFYRRPALFLGPLSGVLVAIVAGFIAFGTDVLKTNVAALINTRAQLTTENMKLSGAASKHRTGGVSQTQVTSSEVSSASTYPRRRRCV